MGTYKSQWINTGKRRFQICLYLQTDSIPSESNTGPNSCNDEYRQDQSSGKDNDEKYCRYNMVRLIAILVQAIIFFLAPLRINKVQIVLVLNDRDQFSIHQLKGQEDMARSPGVVTDLFWYFFHKRQNFPLSCQKPKVARTLLLKSPLVWYLLSSFKIKKINQWASGLTWMTQTLRGLVLPQKQLGCQGFLTIHSFSNLNGMPGKKFQRYRKAHMHFVCWLTES